MRILLAHPGTQHSPRLARELECLHLLGEYWTGFALREGGATAALFTALGRGKMPACLRPRILRGIPATRLHTMSCLELGTIARLRLGADYHATIHRRNEAFQQRISDRSLAAHDAVIGFDTSSWLLAERCQRLGRPFFLDRTSAHPAAVRTIMRDFDRRFPAWSGRTETRPRSVDDAEATEHAFATRIVVGSSFAQATLIAQGVAADKIVVNPYGVDWQTFAAPEPPAARPFRFLFVGTVAAHKGIPILLEAWRRLSLPDTELWIVGGIGTRERRLIPDLPHLRLFGQTPRAQLPAIYAQADVFVFPSLFEGFGLVLLEALAAGLKIIATPHSAAADLLPDERLGELVATGSVEELLAAMQRQRANPPRRTEVQRAAAPLAERFSWAAYGRRWAALLGTK